MVLYAAFEPDLPYSYIYHRFYCLFLEGLEWNADLSNSCGFCALCRENLWSSCSKDSRYGIDMDKIFMYIKG